jgi:hypothetical protein
MVHGRLPDRPRRRERKPIVEDSQLGHPHEVPQTAIVLVLVWGGIWMVMVSPETSLVEPKARKTDVGGFVLRRTRL